MRHVVFSAAMSLDGYIAGPGGAIDWIVMDPELDFAGLFARYDTVLLGRKSYEAARRQGNGAPMPGLRSFVVSGTLRPEDCPDATLARDPARLVRELKAEEGKDIWLFGGGSLFRSLLDLGLVDEVQVAVVPVLLGGGLPLLPPPASRAPLRLAAHRLYAQTGTLLLDYEVAPAAERGRS